MNVYDFDGTVYDGDSTFDFYKYCLKHHPKTWLSIPNFITGLCMYLLGAIPKTKFKEHFFSFLKYVPDVDSDLTVFWNTYKRKIKAWYLQQRQQTDVIISASPEFLLEPVCRDLGIRLIASKVNKKVGAFTGKNCYGDEKVVRLSNAVPIEKVDAFYSDSLADKPLAELVPCSFIVKKDRFIPWSMYKPSTLSTLKRIFFKPSFFCFIFCGGCGTIANFCFSLLLSTFIDSTLSFIGGYSFSIFITFALTSFLIFKTRLSATRFVKFVISYIPNFILSFAFVAVLINIFHVWEVIAYVGAAALGLPISFILINVFAFKNDKNNEENTDQ